MIKRVTGIGGIFFKARDPAALHAWYRDHLGIDVQSLTPAEFEELMRQVRVIAGAVGRGV